MLLDLSKTDVVMFRRDGTEYGLMSTSSLNAGGASVSEVVPCKRCGGEGGSSAWNYTGYTCYRCNGKATEVSTTRVYTEEKLAKLNATADKKAARAAKLAEKKAAELAANLEVRRAAFVAKHGDVVDMARPFVSRSIFLEDIVWRADKYFDLSDKQVNALKSAVKKFLTEVPSKFVGVVGDRTDFLNMTVFNVTSFPSAFGTFFIVAMKTTDGGVVVYKGGNSYNLSKGDTVSMTATVKAHDMYRDTAQTVVNRPKIHNQ
jgi:hypothetical protein